MIAFYDHDLSNQRPFLLPSPSNGNFDIAVNVLNEYDLLILRLL